MRREIVVLNVVVLATVNDNDDTQDDHAVADAIEGGDLDHLVVDVKDTTRKNASGYALSVFSAHVADRKTRAAVLAAMGLTSA